MTTPAQNCALSQLKKPSARPDIAVSLPSKQQADTQAAQKAIAILRDRLPGDLFKEFVDLVIASSFRFRSELEREVRK